MKTSVIPITTKLHGIVETLVNWIPTKIGGILVVETTTIFEITTILLSIVVEIGTFWVCVSYINIFFIEVKWEVDEWFDKNRHFAYLCHVNPQYMQKFQEYGCKVGP